MMPDKRLWQPDAQQCLSILAGISDGLVVIDRHGNPLHINPVAQSLTQDDSLTRISKRPRRSTGYPYRFDVFRPGGESVTEDDHPLTRLLAGETFTNEMRLLRFKDGCRRLAIMSGIQLEGDVRVLLFNFLTPGDSREFYSFFHLCPVAGVLSRLSDGSIIDANERLLELIGYGREELIGRTSSDLGFDLRERKRLLEMYERNGNIRDSALRFRTKAGEERSLVLYSEDLNLGGTAVAFSLLFDVTERQRREEKLQEITQSILQEVSFMSLSATRQLEALRAETFTPADVRLTERERQVLGFIAQGQNNSQIAESLGLSELTVRNHITRLYAKLKVSSRVEATLWARDNGFLRLN